MTVSTEVDHNDYTGNGVTTSFPYTFRIFKKSDLVVQVVDLNENITELILDTDYTVTGAGGYSGGNVTLSVALTSGFRISISRELPVTQETDLRNQGKFFAEVHEDAFDKLTMLIQQVRSLFSLALRKPSFVANYYDALGNYIRNLRDPSRPQDAATKNYVDSVADTNFGRTLRTPEPIPALPAAEQRKNKIVGMDNVGNPIMLLPESGSATDVLIELAKPEGLSNIGVCPDISTLRTLSVPAGRKVMLLGYYSSNPGIGGGVLYASSDNSLSDDGVRVFVTTDGTRLIRETKGELYVSWAGAIGDWNGTSGTDNKAAIERLIAAAGTDYLWIIDMTNVGVSSVVIDNKDGWKGHIQGSVINISAKPAPGAVDRKDQDGGVLPTFKITNCSDWSLTGGYIDNRYRESFFVENCHSFINECDVIGSGINNNLTPSHYRYCTDFVLQNFTHKKCSEKPSTGYYSWCDTIRLWDSSSFRVTDFTTMENGSNGVYVGSNCKDFSIENFTITKNAMSGVQLAWSSFGSFPVRGIINNGLISGNRADAIDVNNTSGSSSRSHLSISGVVSVNNGYNDDGSVTADGSGIGTFINVSHFTVSGCDTTDPARAGLYVSGCSNFSVDQCIIKKDKVSNNEREGVYIENSSHFYVSADVITTPSKQALRLFGGIINGEISGRYVGQVSIDESVASSYLNTKLINLTAFCNNTVVALIPMINCRIESSVQAVNLYTYLRDCIISSSGSNGVVVYGSGCFITGCDISGSDQGVRIQDGLDRATINNTIAKGGASAGIYISGGEKHNIQGSTFGSNTGNACYIINASKVVFLGNIENSPSNFTGTTYTINN